MGNLLDYAPIAAAAFAIPQFLPQLRKLRATDDTAGVSWPWATLTSVNNAAWLAYFALSAYWAALVPACSATLLAGALATMLARRGQATARPAALVCAGPRCWPRPWPSPAAPAWERCSRRPSSSRLPRRSGPPTGPLAPPGSRGAPGCSSSASCRAGPPLACTSPIRALSSSASPGLLQACSCSPGSAAPPQSDDQQHPGAPSDRGWLTAASRSPGCKITKRTWSPSGRCTAPLPAQPARP